MGHCRPPMHELVEKTDLLPCTAIISGGKAFIPGSCQLSMSALTIVSSLMGGCGLNHKHVEDGCKSICVKFGG